MAAFDQKKAVSSALSYGLASYTWVKVFALARMPFVKKPVDFFEGKIKDLTLYAFLCAKIKPEVVVSKFDAQALGLINFFQVKYDAVNVQKQKLLQKLKPFADQASDRYAELQGLLDMQAVRDRLESSAVAKAVLKHPVTTESYAVVKGFVVKASAAKDDVAEKLGEYKNNLVVASDVRVLSPAKDFYLIATVEFMKLTKAAEELVKNPKEELRAHRLSAEQFATKYVASVKAALGEAWSEKLVQPTEAFLAQCKVAYAQAQKTYGEGKDTWKERSEALVVSLRSRLADEWSMRVQPAIQKLKA